jgi:hypothetical protein
MTMTEQTTEVPKPKKRKTTKKRARAKPSPAPEKPTGIYIGITPSDCPEACKADRCVISESGICSHPYKGGLQAMMQTPDAIRRLNAAKRAIGKRKLELTDE